MKLLTALCVVLVLGCSSTEEEPQVICTLIGCENGLNVQVNSSLTQSFTVTVRAGSGEQLHSFTCNPGQTCQAFVAGQTPDEVTVTLATAQGPVSKTFQPEYRLNRPNGPDCPPECKQATIVMTVS